MSMDPHPSATELPQAWMEAERAVQAAEDVARVAAEAVESIRTLAKQAAVALREAQNAAANARTTLAAAQRNWREAMGATDDLVGNPTPPAEGRSEPN